MGTSSDDSRRAEPRQLALALGNEPSFDEENFLVSASNSEAFRLLANWPVWPSRAVVLLGPPGSGKSHLARIWACKAEATVVEDHSSIWENAVAGRPAALVLEDCDRCPLHEPQLFHRLNSAAETASWLLLTARTVPDSWGLRTPDLLSRLRAAPSVSLGQPDEHLIKAVLLKLFTDRQLAVEHGVINYASRHCDRSLSAVRTFVSKADELSLRTRRRLTRAMAADILGPSCEDNAEIVDDDRTYGPT